MVKNLIAVTIGSALLVGCGGSARRISLGEREIITQTPIQFARHSLPIAASRDGSRIALVTEGPKGSHKSILTVIDTDTQEKLASTLISSGGGTIMFGADRETLYRPGDVGCVAWNYVTGDVEQLDFGAPNIPESAILGGAGWNSDRSIGIKFPEHLDGPFAGGRISLTANGKTHEIGITQTFGFDEFGNAWFGKGKAWTRVDKEGRATKSRTRPAYLVRDQTKDRGSMHLRTTESVMRHKGAKAHITCVWLSDDRAVPFTRKVDGKTVRIKESYRAAVVFAGSDVLDFGFLPGRNAVYVVSGFGNYLVPFKIGPTSEH